MRLVPENKVISLMNLYPGKSKDEVEAIVANGLKKRMKPMLFVALAMVILLSVFEIKHKEPPSNLIERNPMDGVNKPVDLILSSDEINSRVIFDVSAFLPLSEEIDELHMKISEYLDSYILSGNSSFSEINSNLNFPDKLPDFHVSLSWTTDNLSLITSDGVLKNEKITVATPVELVAKVYYGSEYRLYRKNVVVKPVTYTKEETIVNTALNELSQKDRDTQNNQFFEVPDALGTVTVSVATKKQVPKFVIGIMLSMILLLYSYSNYFSNLSEKRKKRLLEAEDQYKDFVSRLYLLMSTGLGIRLCLKRINDEYEKVKKQGLLSDNLQVLIHELDTGVLEINAYNNFGNRMESVNFQRLASILIQQTTKGVRNMTETLEGEVKQAYLSDKEKIKIKGEEASTKLLLPMLGMMVIVFAVLLMPALSNF